MNDSRATTGRSPHRQRCSEERAGARPLWRVSTQCAARAIRLQPALTVVALCLAVGPVLLAAPVSAQTAELEALEPLVGRWISSLDERYRNHPMVQRFNPELKPQELELTWGVERGILHLKIWNLDRPQAGDRTLFVEGLIFADRRRGEVRFVEYGGGGTLHRGQFDTSKPTEISRSFEGEFKDGRVARFREIWRWTGKDRTAFEWITLHQADDEWVRGDVVVDWRRVAAERSAGSNR